MKLRKSHYVYLRIIMTAVLIPQHLRGYLIFKQFHTRLNMIKNGDEIPVWQFDIVHPIRECHNLVKYESNAHKSSFIVYGLC